MLKLNEVPTTPGTPLQGGYYVGRFMLKGDLYALIVSPKKEGGFVDVWSNKPSDGKDGSDASSYNDGRSNTLAMAVAHSNLAKNILRMNAGGFQDWHLPSRDELELCYRYLKPSNYTDNMFRAGDNPSSVPPGYPYTEQSPTQTVANEFKEGGTEAFDTTWHWSSTQGAGNAVYAWVQYFDDGSQLNRHKSVEYSARAVRRESVI
ncbi:DUF1566 domain-containing protein [Undibacterium sp. 5I1]|uniref:Lcl C-terminal domain-containing protein n=1 Tax=Undibacterium sp. 5I1 TaxID=3048590 RepID=UPI002AB33636|nr:DUF1566 domain-containing protein [Undibacterium sp. 5I1]MDY7537649.1 DUF1566 domain-containing protein [Undibacterium sp. 5I1]MEB0256386.1 DUF1566 domain-containing protein [Undibacterium sp. 5I1]